MFLKEIIAVYSENNSKHRDTKYRFTKAEGTHDYYY
jgi:hypothetical protein